MDINQLTQLATKWCPLVYLSTGEAYLPCAADWYIANSQLFKNGVMVAGQPGPLTGAFLSTADAATYMVPNSTATKGQNAAPIYVRVTVPESATDCFDFEYWFMYGFNGHSSAGIELTAFGKSHSLTVSLAPFGEHQGDWEHAVVRLDSNYNCLGLYVAEHSWGNWYTPGQFETDSSGRPIVFSAVNSHASYISADTFKIAAKTFGSKDFSITAGLLDETTKGTLWDCLSNGCGVQEVSVNVPSIADPGVSFPWTKFPGHYGSPTDENADIKEATHLIWEALKPFVPDILKDEIKDKVTDWLSGLSGTILPGGPVAPNEQHDWGHGVQGGPNSTSISRKLSTVA